MNAAKVGVSTETVEKDGSHWRSKSSAADGAPVPRVEDKLLAFCW